ncbi:MAG: heme exporter protein CcmD [Gemmobacter sp.]
MIPDLGRHAVWVLSAYGASLALIAVLVGLTLWRAARVRRALRQVEERQGRPGGGA